MAQKETYDLPEGRLHSSITPHEGIVRCILGKISKGDVLSREKKIQFRNSLNWIIENEKTPNVLAWAYRIMGDIYAGIIPEVCE